MATWQRIAERAEAENLRLEKQVTSLRKQLKKSDEAAVKLTIKLNTFNYIKDLHKHNISEQEAQHLVEKWEKECSEKMPENLCPTAMVKFVKFFVKHKLKSCVK